MDTSEGLEPISVPENSGEKNISENVGQSAVMMQLVKVDKHELVHDIYSEIFSQQDKQVYLNDVEIRCQDGIVRAPAPLLSSISPMFKITGPMADIVETPSILMPDFAKADLLLFFDHLFRFNNDENDIEEANARVLAQILDVLCAPFKGSDDPVDALFFFDQMDLPSGELDPKKLKDENKENEPQKPVKRKGGRKPGQKPKIKEEPEPYVKTQVMESYRTSEVYGLRKVVKRKRFTDEISEPSDLDDDENEPSVLLDGEDSDDYAPDFLEQGMENEESDEDDMEDDEDLLEEDFDSPNEEELFDSDEEIISVSMTADKEPALPKGQESFLVKKTSDGNIEIISPDDVQDRDKENVPTASRGRGRPRKRPKMTDADLIGTGRVVSIMEDDDPDQLTFKSKKIYAAAKSDPRSLLKPEDNQDQVHLSLILFCSECEAQCGSQAELKHHVAQNHKGSKFFTMPKNNPHRNCVPCQVLMESFEAIIREEDPNTFSQKDVCFPCPHCRRRFWNLGGLLNHLINDHRNTICSDLGQKPAEYYHALRRTDPRVLTCDFCNKVFPHTNALNKHLIGCADNDSGCSAGLFCHICGKMFAQQRYLKDHLSRHGKDQVNRPRNFMCSQCPVTCVSEANLQKHIEREHSSADPDLDFVLHPGCQRCEALQKSYMENKVTEAIHFRQMVFKCPHCCVVLYANHKHAPAYLYNHVKNFHNDPTINDFTLGGNDPSEFRLRSKLESDVLTCEFCGFTSKSRANHNVHLSTCRQSTVPCKPGYKCETCGFIAGTGIHLRNHLDSHNPIDQYECNFCDYKGRSKRYLLIHHKNHHTEAGQLKRLGASLVPCDKCGKLKKEGAPMKAHLKKCGTGPARVRCNHCDMEFKRVEDMQAHALIHEKRIICPIHNILFQEEREIYQHVNEAEPEDKFPKLSCCICKQTFKHMCLFMKHWRRHLNIAPYKCNIAGCAKEVNTYASLQLHIKRMHGTEQDKPVKEKNFKCDQCLKMFYSRGHLNEHIKGVHQPTNVRCPDCTKTFSTTKRMKKHLLNAHKESAAMYREAGFWKNTTEDKTFTMTTTVILETPN